MDHKMKISVLISVYNGEQFVDQCFKKLMQQTFSDFEVLIFNDRSNDQTLTLLHRWCEQYPERIRVFDSKLGENLGPGGGKGYLIQYVNTEYITFLDIDDYFDLDYLEQFYRERGDADIIISGYRKVDQNGVTLFERHRKNAEQALSQSFFNWCKLYKTCFLIENKLEIPSGRIFDDVIFHSFIFLSKPKCKYIDNCGYNYVFNKCSVSNTYLKSFVEGALSKEMDCFIDAKKRFINTDQQAQFFYFFWRCICWHFLKSGSHVGKHNMLNEYHIFDDKIQDIPEFLNCKKIAAPKYERPILKFVVNIILLLYKMHLLKWFLTIYARLDLSRLWPNG
ncbi:glycosyltransferase family 2 protein [[Clostridium] innocuum]|nr:glycosyltransferase family 2 protein [[Clostridium] innocuum]MCR0575992.1 glycosyltransferase family 2 protein [[Clostridium] innocuum]